MPRTSRDIFAHYGVGPIATDAKHVAEAYFGAIREQDYDGALLLFSSAFFEQTSHESRRETLEGIGRTLGGLKGFSIASRSELHKKDGVWYGLDYRVDYENSPAREKFKLLKKTGEDEIRIVDHKVESKGLGR